MCHCPTEHRLLVARARLGDDAAFGRLVGLYTDRLLWFVRKIGLDDSVAEDVVQQSWLAAWTSLRRLRDVKSFRSWLYRIVRHKSLQHRAQVQDVTSADLDIASEAPEEGFFDQYLSRLEPALDEISVIHREVLTLRFVEGMTYKELSMTLGVTLGTVKSRLHNARLALRDVLEGKSDA